jgi:hypothetical protein
MTDSEYGKADAEVYKIVVAMAENLVPDVCALVMAELDAIHIKEGKTNWEKKIKEVNIQYHNLFEADPESYSELAMHIRDKHGAIYNLQLFRHNQGMDAHIGRLPLNYAWTDGWHLKNEMDSESD